MVFLSGVSVLLGFIITMVCLLISGIIVLGVLMAWYLTKPISVKTTEEEEFDEDGQLIEHKQVEQTQIKESKQKKAKEPVAKESKNKKESETIEVVQPAPVVEYGMGGRAAKQSGEYGEYGSKSAQSGEYGSKPAHSNEYGSRPAANQGMGEYGSRTAHGHGARGDANSSLHYTPVAVDDEETPYGAKKPVKLANVEIDLPKADWGTKPLFERVSALPNAQKMVYERSRYLLKSRLTNYTTDICEVFFNGETPAARLIVYKGQILIFIALETSDINKEKFHVKNVSNLSVSNGLPTLMLIRTMDQANGLDAVLDKLIAG